MNILIVSLVILFLVDLVRYLKKQTLDVFLMSQNLWFEWFAVIGLIVDDLHFWGIWTNI